MSSEQPDPSADPTTPCASCGWGVNDEILDETPDCPHGWQSLEGMPLADIKALFAEGAPDLSIGGFGGAEAVQ